MVLQSDVPW